MKKKIIGIFVCMLLIATAVLPKVPDVSAEETGGSGEQDVRVFNLTDQNVLQSNDVKDVFIYDVTKDDIDYTTWYNDSSLGWWQEMNKSKFPVLWNKLGNETEVNNSKYGQRFNLYGSPDYHAVKYDAGIEFITTSQYAKINNFSEINKYQGCIEFWWKPYYNSNFGAHRSLVHIGEFGNLWFAMYYNHNLKQLIFQIITSGGNCIVKSSGISWNANEVHHLAFCWNIGWISQRARIYFDGEDVSVIHSGNIDWSSYDFQIPTNFVLGYYSGITQKADALFDNIKIWNYAKTNFEDMLIEDSAYRVTHFPTKSYLIATDAGLDIIDADNNELWMRFEGRTGNALPDVVMNSVIACDGIVHIGTDDGLFMINFTDDEIIMTDSTGSASYNGNISTRNDGAGYDSTSGMGIVDDAVNDIALTSDHAFIGTDGGVSLINLSGGLVFDDLGDVCFAVDITDEEELIYHDNDEILRKNSMPTVDWSSDNQTKLTGENYGINDIKTTTERIYIATEDGVYVIDSNSFLPKEGYTYNAAIIGGNSHFVDGSSRVTASIPNDLIYQKDLSTEYWIHFDSYQPGGSAAGGVCYFHPSGPSYPYGSGSYPRHWQGWYRYGGYKIQIQPAKAQGLDVWPFTNTEYNIEDGWHHFTFTFNNTDYGIQLYRDSELVYSGTSPCSAGYMNRLDIGNHVWYNVWNAGFFGHIDEFRLYQRVLHSDEINNSYDRGLMGLPTNNSNPVLYYPFDNNATDMARGYNGDIKDGAYLVFNVNGSVHRNFGGNCNKVTSLILTDNKESLFIGTNDGNNGGGISKIDTMTSVLLSNWTSGNNEALVDYDITSLSFWQHPDNVNVWELLVGTENGASVIFAEEPPETTKTIGDPKYGDNDEWVTSATEFNLTAIDDFSGVDKTYYRLWYNGSWTSWIEYIGNFTLLGEGKHYIEYYSLDNAGNVEGVHNQTHYVDDPVEMINDVIEDIEDMGLCHGIENSLTQKLNNVIQSLGNGQTNAAINQLNAFINQVEAQRGKKLTDEQADALVNVAQQIIDYINNL